MRKNVVQRDRAFRSWALEFCNGLGDPCILLHGEPEIDFEKQTLTFPDGLSYSVKMADCPKGSTYTISFKTWIVEPQYSHKIIDKTCYYKCRLQSFEGTRIRAEYVGLHNPVFKFESLEEVTKYITST
jgi:hypothetical protein